MKINQIELVIQLGNETCATQNTLTHQFDQTNVNIN